MADDFLVGDWLVEPGLDRVSGPEGERHLEPKVMEVLVHLADRAGQVVSKEELLAAVWGDRHVVEAVLTRAIHQIRQLLGDDARAPRVIQTIPKRGYRIIAPIQPVRSPADAPPAGGEPPEDTPSGARPLRAVGGRAWWLAAAALTAFAVVGLVLLQRNDSGDRTPGGPAEPLPPSTAGERKRTAVLPFKNLGSAEDQYLVDGMTEEIISRLAAVSGLAVISSQSSAAYAGSSMRIPQIGQELDADYVLEGAILWHEDSERGRRVRITPQLIRVADDTHVWAEIYEVPIDDIFTIQSQVARNVVERLRVTLLEPERLAVEDRPTDNLEAYQSYLAGRAFANRPEDWALSRTAESLEQAVRLDPAFALAWAELSKAHSGLHRSYQDHSEARRQAARQAAEKALELAPDSPDAQLALGYYLYWVEGDDEQALAAFARAGKGRPADVELLRITAGIHRRRGNWRQSMELMTRAAELAPRDARTLFQLVYSLQALRRYREAVEICDRIIALEPDRAGAYAQKVLLLWFWKGDTAATRAILEIMPPPDDSADALVPFLQEVFARRYPEAIRQLADQPGEWISWPLYSWPKPLLEARVWDLLGERERAAESYATAMSMLEERLQAHPNDPRLHSSLGYALAGLGRKEEAIRAGRHALELVQAPGEALRGPFFLQHLAFIYARVGEPEEALALIDRLLSTPHLGLSVRMLELDPWWDPLREHPQYAQVLAKHRSHAG